MNVREYDVDGASRAVRLISEGTAILALDDVWTGFLAQATRDDVLQQRDALAALVEDLAPRLAVFVEGTGALNGMLQEAGDEAIVEAFRRIKASDPRLADIELCRTTTEARFFREDLDWAIHYLATTVHTEVSGLREKQARIADGEFTEGDLSARWRCAAEIAILGASVAALVLAPPVAGAAAIAVHAVHVVGAAHDAVGLLRSESCREVAGRTVRWMKGRRGRRS